MSKRHVEELQRVYAAILKDVVYAYPALACECERDLHRIQRSLDGRGLRFAAVDLPAAGKHFDKCLARGEYTFSGLPYTRRVSKGVRVPAFLRGLLLLIFEESGRLKDNPPSDAITFVRQVYNLGKKVKAACGAKAVRTEVREFWDVDASLPEPETIWEADVTYEHEWHLSYQGFWKDERYRERMGVDAGVLTYLDRVFEHVSTALGAYRPEDWRFRHGPGAVAETVGPHNKYSWSTWSERLDSVFPISEFGFHNHTEWAAWVSQSGGELSSDEPNSRLIAVPKTLQKPRLIAAEPTSHQWCQQNIWSYLDRRCALTWIGRFITFRDQRRNQRLCLEGSRTGLLATIDLSAASDRVTCRCVGNAFLGRPDLLRALHATRTRVLRQNLNKKVPEMMKLRKFSTMGSAVTFPVESILFLGIALACVLYVRKREPTEDEIRSLVEEVTVFGDDIIVPKDSRDTVVKALESLDFKVNADKSFSEGNFRESCGVDSFRGQVVSPVFWPGFNDGKPESVASTVDVANRFYDRWYLNTAECMASTVRRDNIPVVHAESGSLGFKDRCGANLRLLKQRWNKALQRFEVKSCTPVGKQNKTATNDASGLLQFFTEAPSRFDSWCHGYVQRPILKLRDRWVDRDQLIGPKTDMLAPGEG